MRIPTLILFVAACGGKPADTTDTAGPGGASSVSAAADTADSAASWSLPLRRGSYEATTLGFEDDTCGELVAVAGFYAADADIVWNRRDTFTVDYAAGGAGTVCTVEADGRVVCGGYDQLWADSGGDADLWIRSDTTVFEVISDSAFEQVESLRIFCEGPGCDEVQYAWEWEPPCTVDLRARYERR